jgi:GNAT superfamily N-acetyltransferase
LLVATITGERAISAFVADAVGSGALLVARYGDVPVGFALVGEGILETVYVESAYRRRGLARELVSAVIASQRDVLDAYALPGDRATKSLYEAFGWKARLLTMRAE